MRLWAFLERFVFSSGESGRGVERKKEDKQMRIRTNYLISEEFENLPWMDGFNVVLRKKPAVVIIDFNEPHSLTLLSWAGWKRAISLPLPLPRSPTSSSLIRVYASSFITELIEWRRSNLVLSMIAPRFHTYRTGCVADYFRTYRGWNGMG